MDNLVWWGGALAGAVVAFLAGYWTRVRQAATRLDSNERRAQQVIQDAQREAEALKRTAVLEGKEESLRLKQALEREIQKGRSDLLAAERLLQENETTFGRRVLLVDEIERELRRVESEQQRREAEVRQRDQQLNDLIREQTLRLEKIAGLSAAEARAQLIANLESEARAEGAKLVAAIRENAQRSAEQESRRVVTLAIQRYAGDHVSEATVSVVHLPGDEMKGRIIGREGRNIRSFETITGVDAGSRHPLLLRPGAARGGASRARAAGGRRPHPSRAHRGGRREDPPGSGGQDP
jgi:ribonuclease Y